MQSHATDLSTYAATLAVLSLSYTIACHCVMQSQPKSSDLTFSETDMKTHTHLPGLRRKKKHEIPTKLYLRAGFARPPVTYNTYIPIQYTIVIHIHTCMLFSAYCIQLLVAYKCWTLCLSDCWMLDSLQFLKCNSELLFSFSTMITLWQYIEGTCY